MLWSDDRRDPAPQDARRAIVMLRRAMLVVALAAAVAMALAGWHV